MAMIITSLVILGGVFLLLYIDHRQRNTHKHVH